MMRRVELLPAAYKERRRQRQTITTVIGIGVALVGLMIVWWFMLGGQVSDAESDLATVEATNRQLQAQIDELQEFADLDAEVQTKRGALTVVMTGDVDWPGLMTELAMVIPGEVWLSNFNGSAGVTEGSTPVGTETAAVRINPDAPFGRISFVGKSLSMSGVAKWLVSLSDIKAFEAMWLNDASEETAAADAGPQVFSFDNTVELNPKAASERFLEGEL